METLQDLCRSPDTLGRPFVTPGSSTVRADDPPLYSVLRRGFDYDEDSHPDKIVQDWCTASENLIYSVSEPKRKLKRKRTPNTPDPGNDFNMEIEWGSLSNTEQGKSSRHLRLPID